MNAYYTDVVLQRENKTNLDDRQRRLKAFGQLLNDFGDKLIVTQFQSSFHYTNDASLHSK